MGSLFKKKGAADEGKMAPEGVEHLRTFPLVCRAGDEGNRQLEAGMTGRAQREYLKVLHYLAGKGLIDPFLLGKAYVSLMAVALKLEGNQLKALVNGPSGGGFKGPMEVVGAFHDAAHDCFQEKMLSPSDHQLFHDLCAYARGTLPRPPAVRLSRWDLSLATREKFPVTLQKKVVCVLERAAPPQLAPELKDAELDIQVPGL